MPNNVTQIAALISQLNSQVEDLAFRGRNDSSDRSAYAKTSPPSADGKASAEMLQMKQSISASMAKIQTMLLGPTELLQQLAFQFGRELYIFANSAWKKNQLLACLQWLGEFQILAYIPLNNSVSLEDIADLSSVPQMHLRRVVRMTAAAGFLQEPQPDHVAHTALSAQFVTQRSYHDAAMFLANTAAPAASHMARATHVFGASTSPTSSAYNYATGTTVPFLAMCEQNPQLRRQWPAYLQHVLAEEVHGGGTGGVDLIKSLGCFERLDNTMSPASVVEVGATATERASMLAKQYLNLSFMVQLIGSEIPENMHSGMINRAPGLLDTMQTDSQSSGRIAISYRGLGTRQPIRSAAFYLMDLSPVGMGSSMHQVSAEVREHLTILRTNSNSALVIISYDNTSVDKSTTISPEKEAIPRLRELCMFQLSNQHQQSVSASDLSELVNSCHDATGRLSVMKRVCSETETGAQWRSKCATGPTHPRRIP
ncbi:hypothetical protein PG984_013938 [Apiospora sp. TS-2023a]